MSYMERRRFLWMLFLTGLVALGLSAALANATTLARLRFEDLAQQANAVARLRCLGSEARWEGGEIWTETRFEVIESDKGLLAGLVTVRMIGGSVGHVHSRVDGVPVSEWRRGLPVFVGTVRRTVSHFGVVARNVSHCSKFHVGSRNGHAGFGAGVGLRSEDAGVSAWRHPQSAGGTFPGEALESAEGEELTQRTRR